MVGAVEVSHLVALHELCFLRVESLPILDFSGQSLDKDQLTLEVDQFVLLLVQRKLPYLLEVGQIFKPRGIVVMEHFERVANYVLVETFLLVDFKEASVVDSLALDGIETAFLQAKVLTEEEFDDNQQSDHLVSVKLQPLVVIRSASTRHRQSSHHQVLVLVQN